MGLSYQECLLALLAAAACAGLATLFLALGGWAWKYAVRAWRWVLWAVCS